VVSRVGIIGARGIANYGGFETVVGELAPRLGAMGYEVYCSHRRVEAADMKPEYKKVRILYFPMFFPSNHKAARLFEVLYDWYFLVKCVVSLKCDIVYCLGVASGPLLIATKLSRAKTCVNLDGLEWKRRKFGLLDKAYIKLAFATSCAGASVCILDNAQLRRFFHSKVVEKAVVIPYGVSPIACGDWSTASLDRYCKGDVRAPLDSHGFLLVVARLEPENNIDVILRAYSGSRSTRPLVVVGDFSSPGYRKDILSLADSIGGGKQVLFTGSIFERRDLEMLRCHCMAYIHGHSVGGTNPSLLEAMSARDIIVAHDNVFNREVCEDSALYFKDETDLSSIIDSLDSDLEPHMNRAAKALEIVKRRYNWEDIARAYDELFRRLSRH